MGSRALRGGTVMRDRLLDRLEANGLLVLASASPRRRELLRALGVPFLVQPVNVDESVPAEVIEATTRLGDDAARDALPKMAAHWIAVRKCATAVDAAPQGTTVLAADTLVALGGRVLGKPADAQEARMMLAALRGRQHDVWTGFTMTSALRLGGAYVGDMIRTAVTMRAYTDEEIEASIAAGTPFDKAGGYGIQDPALHPVESHDGCYCNVMGLPLWRVRELLTALRPDMILQPPDETYPRCTDCPLRKNQR